MWFVCSQAKELPTLKDNDFVNDGAVINIGPKEKDRILNILQKDVEVHSLSNLLTNVVDLMRERRESVYVAWFGGWDHFVHSLNS